MIPFLDLRAALGAAGSHTPGERGSNPRPATNLDFRATRAGCDTRAAEVPVASTSQIGGVARSFALDVSEPDEVPAPGTKAACPRRDHSAPGRMTGVGWVRDPQGEGRFRLIGVAVSVLSHAILIAVLLLFGAVAAGMAAAVFGFLFVVAPGNPRRRR